LPASRTLSTIAVTAVVLSGCTMGHDAGQPASGPVKGPSGSSTAPGTASMSASAPAEQPSAKDVWSRTQQSVCGYTSLSLTGTDSADGSGPRATFLGELDGEPSEMSYEGDEVGHVTMRRISHDVYLKGDRTYWDSVDKDDPSLQGSSPPANRWIKVPESAFGQKDLSDLSAKSYIEAMGDTTDAKWGHLGDGTLTPETLDGRPAYKIVSADGDTRAWVTTDDTHDLLKVVDEAAGTDDLGTATFSRWNEKIAVPRPVGALDGGEMAPDPSPSGEATT